MTTPAPVADWGIAPVISTDVDSAVISTLAMWLPTYLTRAETDRSLDAGYMPRPRAQSYTNALANMEFTDRPLPTIVVTTAPTEGNTIRNADDTYQANWNVVVSCIVRGQTPPGTRHNASLMEGAVRRVLDQQAAKMDDTPIHFMRWVSSGVAPVPDLTGEGRYLAAGTSRWTAMVDQALGGGAGPNVPDADPYDDLSLVQSVEIDGLGLDIHFDQEDSP